MKNWLFLAVNDDRLNLFGKVFFTTFIWAMAALIGPFWYFGKALEWICTKKVGRGL
jgi:hypothetical protein